MEESANTNMLIHTITILRDNIRKSKKSLISLDANSEVLEQLELMTKTKEQAHKLIGCYNKLFGSDLVSDLKSLSGNTDIQKRYLKPFITLGIVQGDHPFELNLRKNEIDELVSNCPLDEADSISLDSNISKSSSGWMLFKWVGIIWSLFCLIGVITGIINVLIKFNGEGSILTAIGSSIGMGLWLFIWSSIAGPSALIYYLSKDK